ncbi:MAG: XTP/dITP diphosphatase [Deltaproteobacteria bacterium]|nr:XTP/dITP diphosphatase [Deltaproteobacteria bacterium]
MKLDRPLVIATRNQGKVSEFKELLKDFDIEIKSLQDFGPLPEIQEDGETFEDNAVKKARFAARILGLPALADDSGLVVRALGGLPGVHSARYAGEHGDDLANNRKLLQAMKGIKYREATFVCVIAIAVPRGPALLYEGTCNGIITEEITGTGGFGYDPVFYYPPLGKTFAEMTPEEKNRVSHRGKAMAELREEFDKVLIWLRQRLEEEPF